MHLFNILRGQSKHSEKSLFLLLVLLFAFCMSVQKSFAQDIASSSSYFVLKIRPVGTSQRSTGEVTTKIPAPKKSKTAAKTSSKTNISSKNKQKTESPGINNGIRIVSAGVLNDKMISPIRPIYPAGASGVSGSVNVQVRIDENGDVVYASAISGPPELRQAAVTSVLKTYFEPVVIDGHPVRVVGIILINFVK